MASNPVARSNPLYRQICTHFEKQILSGQLASGAKLPTTKAIAEDFGVTVETAQKAAVLLTRRGLLERVPGRGSFVTGRVHSRTIGIVCGTNVFADPALHFYQQIYGLLCKQLRQRAWNVKLYFPDDDLAPERCCAEINQDIESGLLRGLIPLCGGRLSSRVLESHPHLPVAQQGVGSHADHLNNACRGAAYLLGCGYRRIAVIAHTASSGEKGVRGIEEAVGAAHAEAGLEGGFRLHCGAAARHAEGAARMREALADPRGRPDAVLVLNDMACMGAIFELLCQRYRIPEDMAVLGVSNKGTEIPSPVPLTRLEHDPARFAQAHMDSVLARIEGTDYAPELPLAELVVGASCGEGRSRGRVAAPAAADLPLQEAPAAAARGRAGFTLVELLVVMAIIGILASLILPSMETALDAARKITCMNNLKQTGFATVQYVDDHGDTLPNQGRQCAGRIGLIAKGNNVEDLWMVYEAYLGGELKNDPSDTYPTAIRLNPLEVWRCPSNGRPSGDLDDWNWGSYGYQTGGIRGFNIKFTAMQRAARREDVMRRSGGNGTVALWADQCYPGPLDWGGTPNFYSIHDRTNHQPWNPDGGNVVRSDGSGKWYPFVVNPGGIGGTLPTEFQEHIIFWSGTMASAPIDALTPVRAHTEAIGKMTDFYVGPVKSLNWTRFDPFPGAHD